MNRYKPGFTIIEVIIVVVVIGILVSLGVVAYSRVQADTRDKERAADISVIADALEQYYSENSGVYPGCTAMTQAGDTVTSSTLVGMDPSALVAPKAPSGTSNSIGCTSLTSGSGADTYAYVGNVNTNCSTGAYCYQYTLQYRQETTGNIISRRSVRCTQYSYQTYADCTW
jgi:prepilin-type N-terminal cleavage/methylation domain-containing protein